MGARQLTVGCMAEDRWAHGSLAGVWISPARQMHGSSQEGSIIAAWQLTGGVIVADRLAHSSFSGGAMAAARSAHGS